MTLDIAQHGGPDAFGTPLHDFSTNANACGPCPDAWTAVAAADATRYPDPTYQRLRERIARFHEVAVERVHFAASASEFIMRMSAAAAATGAQSVAVPQPGYGDYARAANAHGLVLAPAGQAQLVWICDPASPTGQRAAMPHGMKDQARTLVIDRAYAPLRLQGRSLDVPGAWEMWTPNKALGLTGVRGAYAIAPTGQDALRLAERLEAMLPSWPVGAHGVALLECWTEPQVHQWLARSLATLRDWKAQQIECLERLDWECMPSEVSFFCARPRHLDGGDKAGLLAHLRNTHGIKLRDGTSLGLPGWLRLNVLAPPSQQALHAALVRWG